MNVIINKILFSISMNNAKSKHYVNNYNGPLLAINEFNNENNSKKIAQDFGSVLNYKYGCYGESIFTYHHFNHKKYNNYLDISVGKLD